LRIGTKFVAAWLVAAGAFSGVRAGPPVPLGDRVLDPLLPSGISEHDVGLNARLAYIFREDDGAEVLHFIGDFVLTTGVEEVQTARADEAVVWIENRMIDQRPFRHLQMLLWRDVSIVEVAGTRTTGPALFVTMSSYGKVNVQIDEVAYQPSRETRPYREGIEIRRLVAEAQSPDKVVSTHLGVLDASRVMARTEEKAPRPRMQFRSGGQLALSVGQDDGQAMTATGGVFLSRGIPGSGDALEISADSVVVFLPPTDRAAVSERDQEAGMGATPRLPTRSEEPADPKAEADRQWLTTGFGDIAVESAYLEGDVVMRQGANMIRASRIYFDFVSERAMILDAIVRSTVAQRNLPLYVRADEIRQLSRRQLTADNAILTTSEFHTPHYAVGASRIELINRTPSDVEGRLRALRSGSFRIRDATLNILGTPIIYWPYLSGDIDTSETAIRSLRTGYSDDFGFELESQWHLFNVLNLEKPDGFDATLSLDYYSERGPAAGVDVEYTRDRYFGLLRSYLIADRDEDFLGRDREHLDDEELRGRFLLRHKQYLEDDWEVSLELAYISDRGFLEEFFENEFDNEKEQETLLRLKKQRDNWAITGQLQARLMDFVTQTERWPDFGMFLIGERLGGGPTLFSENRLGMVRFRPAEQTFREFLRDGRMESSGMVGRIDSRQEMTFPFDLGAVRLTPFVSVRGTAWDDSPEDGGIGRAFGTYGMSGSMYFWKLLSDVRSTMFDIDGLRHVIKPTVTAWVSQTNRDSEELYPFDETVEGIDEFDGVSVGIRQRFQTMRGPENARRPVDVFTWDLDAGAFNDLTGGAETNGFVSVTRPETSIARNYVNSSVIWRLNDRTALLSELNYDMNDGEVDVFNLSLAVERPPRFSYLVGYRLIEETDSELLGVDMNYRLTEKHTLAIREQFDLREGRTLDFTVALIRRFPRWFGAVSFALDEAEDDFGVSLSVWPEGLPEAALGSRRFTGLASSTRLQGE
jgi:hypothetical protein